MPRQHKTDRRPAPPTTICPLCNQRTARLNELCIPCQQQSEHELAHLLGDCLNCGMALIDAPENDGSGLCYYCRKDLASANLTPAEGKEMLDFLTSMKLAEPRPDGGYKLTKKGHRVLDHLEGKHLHD